MKRDEIKRIADIIGLERLENSYLIAGDGWSEVIFDFDPHTNWQHTGMLLEWLIRKKDLRWYFDGNSYSIFMRGYPVPVLLGRGETPQLAICNSVLQIGECNE